MAFFDEVGKKLTQASQDAIQKTKDMADISKYNTAISNEEKVLNDIYFQLGKVYFETNNNPDVAYQSYFDAIRASIKKIEDMKQTVQALRSVIPCPNCGTEMKREAIFCNVCGTAMPKTQYNTAQPAFGKVCTTCGNVVADGINFCTVCGTPVQQVQPPVQPVQPPVQPVQQPMATIRCAACNTECPANAAFCVACGNKISG